MKNLSLAENLRRLRAANSPICGPSLKGTLHMIMFLDILNQNPRQSRVAKAQDVIGEGDTTQKKNLLRTYFLEWLTNWGGDTAQH